MKLGSDGDEPRVCHTGEVSQKEKNKYPILMHIYGIQKNGTDELICKAGIERKTKRMDL